jgi:hypothetical protein
MSVSNILFIVLFVIVFLIGLLMIIYSKQFNTWAIDYSTRNVKGPRDAPYTEGFRRSSLWILRAVGLLVMVEGVLALVYFFSHLHR